MKCTPTLIFAAVFGMALSVSTLASAKGYQDQSQSQPSSMGASSDQSAGGAAGEPAIVRGTAVAVDADQKSITLTDFASGGEKTFAVSRTEELKDIKPGDKVSVTPQKNNASSAQKVQKDEAARP
jgi:hypothetical protein